MTMPPNRPYNAWPFPRAKPRAPDTLTRPEEQLRKDLRALERVQATRPLRPPGKR